MFNALANVAMLRHFAENPGDAGAATWSAEVDPRYVDWTGEGTPEQYVISKNPHRRHLNESQRAMIAARLANAKSGERRDLVQICTRSVTATEAGDLLNVSRGAVQAAKVVQQRGTPEEIAAVEKGEAAVSTVAKACCDEAVV